MTDKRPKNESAVMEYVMVIENEDGGYWAHFPDLPGCFTDGDTLEELQENARDAVETHLDGLRELGDPIPEPAFRTAKVAVQAS